MADINAPIPYQWTLGWAANTSPVVNPLLKAILEYNVPQMEQLAAQGADLRQCDKTTLQYIIFHVIENYSVMKWLVDHGLSRIGNDIDGDGSNGINSTECISPNGFVWGLTGRAYLLKAYDVMELLASHGFDAFYCFDKGWKKDRQADREILQTGDARGLQILLENGYCISDDDLYEKYVLYRPQVHRKTNALDFIKFKRTIPQPRFEAVPLLFGRKDAQYRNARRQEDYEDRVRAYQEFRQKFGPELFDAHLREKELADREFSILLRNLSKNF